MARNKVKKITVLITGGNGYIGSHLKQYLSARYRVIAPTHHSLDLLNLGALEQYIKRQKPDIVIHAAVVGGSKKGEEVAGSLEMNLRMLTNILRCHKYIGKIIHLGSGAEYDKTRSLVRVKETIFGDRIPTGPYGFYKYVASQLLSLAPNAVNLRIFGIFGPGEDYRFRFISNAICRNVFGMPITISQNVRFDYIYIKDFVRIVEWFITHSAKYPCYNIGTGKRLDIVSIAKRINAISKRPSEIQVRRTGWNCEYSPDVSRLRSELPRFSFTDFDDTLREMFAWYIKRKKQIDPSRL